MIMDESRAAQISNVEEAMQQLETKRAVLEEANSDLMHNKVRTYPLPDLQRMTAGLDLSSGLLVLSGPYFDYIGSIFAGPHPVRAMAEAKCQVHLILPE